MKTFEEKFKRARNIKMTANERNVLLYKVTTFIDTHGAAGTSYKNPIRSPYTNNIFGMRFAKGFALAAIVLLMGGGSMVFASQDALPGDTLYSVKVHVMENIQGALALSPEAKIEWQTARVGKRLAEISMLQAKGRLNNGEASAVKVAFSSNSDDLNQSLAQIPQKDKSRVSATVVATLGPALERFETENTAVEKINASTSIVSAKEKETPSQNSTNSITPTSTKVENSSDNKLDMHDEIKTDSETSALIAVVREQKEKFLTDAQTDATIDANDTSDKNNQVVDGNNENKDGSAEKVDSLGILKGKVNIGPICAVEQVGVACAVPPETYTSRTVIIFTKDTHTEVVRANLKEDGTYVIKLPVGTYTIEIAQNGMDRASGLPESITIQKDTTVEINFSIDTGIRTPIKSSGSIKLSPLSLGTVPGAAQ